MKDAFLVILCFISIGLFSCESASVRESQQIDKELSLAENMMVSPSWPDRVEAVQIASKWINIRSQTLLLSALQDSHQRVVIEAIKGLSLFRSLQSFEAIKIIAENENDSLLRLVALQSLSQFQNPRASNIFKAAFKNTDWMIREAAIVGLLDIPDPNIEEQSIEYVIDALSDTEESVRIAALQHLRIKDERFYFILRAQLADEALYSRPLYLKAILSALNGYKFDDATRRRLITFITHPNPEIRSMAYNCIKTSDQLSQKKK